MNELNINLIRLPKTIEPKKKTAEPQSSLRRVVKRLRERFIEDYWSASPGGTPRHHLLSYVQQQSSLYASHSSRPPNGHLSALSTETIEVRLSAELVSTSILSLSFLRVHLPYAPLHAGHDARTASKLLPPKAASGQTLSSDPN